MIPLFLMSVTVSPVVVALSPTGMPKVLQREIDQVMLLPKSASLVIFALNFARQKQGWRTRGRDSWRR